MAVRLLEESGRACLADENAGVSSDAREVSLGCWKSIALKVSVALPRLQPLDFVKTCAGDFDALLLTAREALVLSVVGTDEGGTAERALDRCAVHDDSVLHIVAVMAEDSDNKVLPTRTLSEVRSLHRTCTHNRLLRVVHDVHASVWAEPVISRRKAEALLDHRCTTSNSWS